MCQIVATVNLNSYFLHRLWLGISQSNPCDCGYLTLKACQMDLQIKSVSNRDSWFSGSNRKLYETIYCLSIIDDGKTPSFSMYRKSWLERLIYTRKTSLPHITFWKKWLIYHVKEWLVIKCLLTFLIFEYLGRWRTVPLGERLHNGSQKTSDNTRNTHFILGKLRLMLRWFLPVFHFFRFH